MTSPTPERWELEFDKRFVLGEYSVDVAIAIRMEIKSFIRKLLAECAEESRREGIEEMKTKVMEVLTRWRTDGQSFTKGVLEDLEAALKNV